MVWADPAKATAYHREYWRSHRRQWIEYMGGKCVICGITENLHFDHKDPEKKKLEINRILRSSDTQMIKSELAKCQLLCKKHHLEKTAREATGFTHGTIYGWMRKKCRCNLCAPAHRAWHDARNLRLKKARLKGNR